jgi:hypothetical protein
MKVRCPICDTENRGIAKFCIECVNPLPTALAALGFARTEFSPPPESSRVPKARPGLTPVHEPNRGAWFTIGALVVALTVGSAAGWLLSGPGAVYKAEPVAASSPPLPALASPVQKDRVAKPVAVARPMPREPVEPGAACAGLNFFAVARCMAAQCLKPAFKPHAQCEAVRRQQHLEAEKRNPILAN